MYVKDIHLLIGLLITILIPIATVAWSWWWYK